MKEQKLHTADPSIRKRDMEMHWPSTGTESDDLRAGRDRRQRVNAASFAEVAPVYIAVAVDLRCIQKSGTGIVYW